MPGLSAVVGGIKAACALLVGFRRRQTRIPATRPRITIPSATPIPIPAFAPVLRPLDAVVVLAAAAAAEVAVAAVPEPVDDEVGEGVAVEDVPAPKPRVVAWGRCDDNNANTGLFAPNPAVVLGLKSKLHSETPWKLRATSMEPL